MRFIADGMLGKLARWLRLMGCDVLYGTDFTDDYMLEMAHDRTILTRDRELYKRAGREGRKAILVRDTGIKGQLGQMEEAGIKLLDTPEAARCPLCNGEILSVERENIKAEVPSSVAEFFVCRDCKNVYWEGSHWKNIKDTIKDVRGRGKDVQNPKRR